MTENGEHRHVDDCYEWQTLSDERPTLICEFKDTVPDPIDTAIAAVEAAVASPEPDHLIADITFTDGTTMKLAVPIDFDADKFESAVGTLMQMRVAADQRKEAAKSKIAVPDHGIISLEGRRLI